METMSVPKYSTFLAAAVIALTAAAPALAHPEEVAVRYQDLNLTSVGDRATLDRRLEAAAKDVCSAHGTFDIAARNASRNCRAAVVSDARQKAQIVVAQKQSRQQVATAK